MTEFWVFVTYSDREVTTGSDYHLRHSDTHINPFTRRWYKWLCVDVVVQTSIWYRYGIFPFQLFVISKPLSSLGFLLPLFTVRIQKCPSPRLSTLHRG